MIQGGFNTYPGQLDQQVLPNLNLYAFVIFAESKGHFIEMHMHHR